MMFQVPSIQPSRIGMDMSGLSLVKPPELSANHIAEVDAESLLVRVNLHPELDSSESGIVSFSIGL